LVATVHNDAHAKTLKLQLGQTNIYVQRYAEEGMNTNGT